MRASDRESLARVKRAARLAQLAVDRLGSTQAADEWLSTPSSSLGGKRPSDMHYDASNARKVARALKSFAGQLGSR